MRATQQEAVNTTEATAPDTTEATDTTEPTPDTTDPGIVMPEVDPIEWGECDDEAAEGNPDLECATLTVPLDYADPEGDTIDVVMVRQPALRRREGAVLFNPGGPGGSGFDPIAYSGDYIQESLGLEAFDIVGFDPRGVDRSGGIRCLDDDYIDETLYLDWTPDTPEEERLLEEDETAFDDGCRERYGDTLRHYSTANTARDMDMIRAGLGDDQMSFLGISYGTYLGGVYATLFPERVRAMVLDAAYEPNGDSVEEQYLTQVVGFEEAFNNWAAWCEENTDCAFHADDVPARWDALFQDLDDNERAGSDGRIAHQAVMDTATSAALYSESEWPVLAQALADAEAGDPDGLFSLADSYRGRNADGTFNTLFQSIGVILCASGIEDEPIPDPEAFLEELQEKAPRAARDVVLEDLEDSGNNCDGLMDDQPVVELDYSGDGPILVVGGLNDPATPFRWSEEMTDALGPNARLLTFTGEGHGQLLTSTCVTDYEAQLLADLELPDEGTVCDPDPKVEKPAWWDSQPVPPGVGPVESLPAVGNALGLSDTVGFGDIRRSTLDPEATIKAYNDAFDAAGWEVLGSEPVDDLGDTWRGSYFTPEGDFVVIFAMGPEAFATDAFDAAG
ncbi:MAG TPA: hypothetical protein DCR14_15935, partial [Acidimicrobiaceae bacterium]|nr:hypothetical protein [Acidimicrobiaceae bacterium]